jgi:hypothetical protein
MPAILTEEPVGFSVESLKRPAVICSCLVVVFLFAAYVQTLHYIHDVGASHIPLYFFPLFPLTFALIFVVSFPLLMFISYAKEFPNCNPARPKDYWMLCKRTFGALKNGKIKQKDV